MNNIYHTCIQLDIVRVSSELIYICSLLEATDRNCYLEYKKSGLTSGLRLVSGCSW